MAAPTEEMANLKVNGGMPEQKKNKGDKKKGDKKGKEKAPSTSHPLEVFIKQCA